MARINTSSPQMRTVFFGEVGVFTGEKQALEAIAKTDGVIGRVPGMTAKKSSKTPNNKDTSGWI